MSDIVDRARRLLQQGQAAARVPVPAKPPAVPAERQSSAAEVKSVRCDVLAEARALLDRPTRTTTPAAPQPGSHALPRPLPVPSNAIRVPMTCGKSGRPFVAIAESHGKNLVLTCNELPQPDGSAAAAGSSSSHAAVDLGSYRIAAAPEWCCPHCRTRVNTHPLIMGELVWQCFCAGQTGALHCVGSDPQGGTYCACGLYEVRGFSAATSFAVRGERAPAGRTNRPEPPRAATMRSASPPAATPAAPAELPASSPKLPWKG